MAGRGSASRYAQAVFELALQGSQLEKGAEDLRTMVDALQNSELKAFLEHAKIPLERKVQLIGEVLRTADPMMRNLLCLLVSRGLVDLAPEIEKRYQQLLNKFKGIEQVGVYSAVPLEDPEKERISRYVSELIDKEVLLNASVDDSILGGLIIRVGDRLIDGSTRTRLEELGKQLQRDTTGIGV